MENWDKVFEEVPASFEDRIVSTLASLEEKPKIRRFRMPAGGLIAAVLTVVVLGGTALATNLFGLKSITVADPYATPEAVGDVIALQGAPESPEFRANAQWMDYLASVGVSAGDEAPADGSYALVTLNETDEPRAIRVRVKGGEEFVATLQAKGTCSFKWREPSGE